jgi:ATP-dependent DNA helicase RecG
LYVRYYPYIGANISDLDETKIENFIDRVNESGRFKLVGSPMECLSKLRLIKDDMPTNAAMLLFSREELFFNIHIGRYKTQSMIIDDKMIRGSLFESVENTITFILSHIKVAFEITGKTSQRTEIFEYPLPAIRELVLNAIIHRDYKSPTDIQIRIYDQEITIFNPGGLFGGFEIDELKTDNYQAQSRNKLITEAFILPKILKNMEVGIEEFVNIFEIILLCILNLKKTRVATSPKLDIKNNVF